MPPQTPLLFVDNVYDSVNQYPTATVVGANERIGHEGYRVADYRRERTSYQASLAAASQYVSSDLGATLTRPTDGCFIDRGHNLWGKTVQILGDDGAGGSAVFVNRSVPALGTLGGDPTSGTFCVTEEGALYTIYAALAARRRWLTFVIESMVPSIPGIILGMRTQLLGYSRTFDEDAGERTEATTTSEAGYRGAAATYSWRTIDLDLDLIGATEYDASIRALRELLFKRNQPWVCAMNYGINPERAWMYQYEGKSWGFSKKRVHRAGRIRGREVGASLS